MNNLLLRSLLVSAAMLLGVPTIGAYCIYYENPESGTKLRVLVFKDKSDWQHLDQAKKIEASAKKYIASLSDRIIASATAFDPSVGEIAGVGVKLASPVADIAAFIHEKVVLKGDHTLDEKNRKACWNWKSIEGENAAKNRTMYAVILDETNNTFLGAFEFDARGYARIKVALSEDGSFTAWIARVDYTDKGGKYPYAVRDFIPEEAQGKMEGL